MRVSQAVEKITPELVELRRDFHRHPELGLSEVRTSAKVMEYLKGLGMSPVQLNKTGVAATLEGGKPGKTLMLRADMDALPVTEDCDVPYRSICDGVMHACGHDGHTAMLLAAASILSSMKEELKGNIKFVFEPNEENVGALAMIEEGVLENPKVDACMGLHLWSPIRTGEVAITPGPVMAGMDHFDILIRGRGGHTATPQTAVDPILAAADVVKAVQTIQTREINPLTPTIIMFGSIRGGTAANVIPDQVQLQGTIRYLYDGSPGTEEDPKARMRRVVEGVCGTHRAEAEIEFLFGHPALINHPEMTLLARSAAAKVLGDESRIGSFISMAGEDFSEFAARVPGVFIFVGAGNPEKGCDYPHHHPKFNIDEDALPIGVSLLVNGALEYLDS